MAQVAFFRAETGLSGAQVPDHVLPLALSHRQRILST